MRIHHGATRTFIYDDNGDLVMIADLAEVVASLVNSTEAEIEGRHARLAGCPLLRNPYRNDVVGSRHFRQWEWGWRAEDRALRTGQD